MSGEAKGGRRPVLAPHPRALGRGDERDEWITGRPQEPGSYQFGYAVAMAYAVNRLRETSAVATSPELALRVDEFDTLMRSSITQLRIDRQLGRLPELQEPRPLAMLRDEAYFEDRAASVEHHARRVVSDWATLRGVDEREPLRQLEDILVLERKREAERARYRREGICPVCQPIERGRIMAEVPLCRKHLDELRRAPIDRPPTVEDFESGDG